MKNEENVKVVDVEEVKTVEETADTEAKESKVDKLKGFMKRNWKKVAIGAVTVIGVAAAVTIGSKISGSDEAIAALPVGDSGVEVSNESDESSADAEA
jgi:hypothetical protein